LEDSEIFPFMVYQNRRHLDRYCVHCVRLVRNFLCSLQRRDKTLSYWQLFQRNNRHLSLLQKVYFHTSLTTNTHHHRCPNASGLAPLEMFRMRPHICVLCICSVKNCLV